MEIKKVNSAQITEGGTRLGVKVGARNLDFDWPIRTDSRDKVAELVGDGVNEATVYLDDKGNPRQVVDIKVE